MYPHAHPKDQVNLWLQIHTGSLQEEDNERGVAHFVEHMMFNGTKTWPVTNHRTFESWACVLVAMLMPIPAMTKRCIR
ncbi:insulinase family protein [Escherichia coli]